MIDFRTIEAFLSARLPDLAFVVGWPSSPGSFAAQKAARIALQVARERKGS